MATEYVGGPDPASAKGLLTRCLRAAPTEATVGLQATADKLAKQLARHSLPCGFDYEPPDDLESLNSFTIFAGTNADDQEQLLTAVLQTPQGARAVGSLAGMAVADSVGHMFEFLPVGKEGHHFDPEALTVTEPYNKFALKPGQWTDDTAMGLCLADSLLARGRYDGSDIRSRFWNWWFRGYNNAFRLDPSRDRSVGLGGNIGTSLRRMGTAPTPRFEAPPGSQDAGNGSLMRLAPLPVFLHSDARLASRLSSESSLTTHPGPIAADACAFLGFAIAKAVSRPGESSETAAQFLDACVEAFMAECEVSEESELARLLRGEEPPGSPERCWNWRDPAGPFLLETLAARGNRYNGYPVLAGYFGSYSMDGLAIALHSVYHTNSFMEAIARCVNFLGDSDSHGSICGQLAGAFYGVRGIDGRLLTALESWDEGQVALRGAHLFALGAQLTSDELTAMDASSVAESSSSLPVKKRKQVEVLEEKPKQVEVLDADGELGAFPVYPRTHCPHLKCALPVPAQIPLDAKCAECGESEVWICGQCSIVLCSRYKQAHMVKHVAAEGHQTGLSLGDLSFWCFACDSYLDIYAIGALQPLYSAAHLAKFGERPPLPGGSTGVSSGGAGSSSAA